MRAKRGSSLALLCFLEGSRNLGSLPKLANLASSGRGYQHAIYNRPVQNIACYKLRGFAHLHRRQCVVVASYNAQNCWPCFFFARDVPVAEEGAADFVGIVWRFGSGIAVCDDVCDGRAELRVLRNFFARDPRLH